MLISAGATSFRALYPQAQDGVVQLALGYATTGIYHECDDSVRRIGSDDRTLEDRKRCAQRIRFYNAQGVSFSSIYAARLP